MSRVQVGGRLGIGASCLRRPGSLISKIVGAERGCLSAILGEGAKAVVLVADETFRKLVVRSAEDEMLCEGEKD